jgi:hypothetical protein
MAGPPLGVEVAVTCEVVLTWAPSAIPRTLTMMVHDCPAVRTLDVLEKVSVPGLIEKNPPPVAGVLHVPPSCVMRSTPAGMVSLNWTLEIANPFGFVTVMVASESPLIRTVDGLKSLVIVGGSACADAFAANTMVKSIAISNCFMRSTIRIKPCACQRAVLLISSGIARILESGSFTRSSAAARLTTMRFAGAILFLIGLPLIGLPIFAGDLPPDLAKALQEFDQATIESDIPTLARLGR